MFFVLRPGTSSTFEGGNGACRPHRRYCGGLKHRGGKFNRMNRFHPYVFVDLEDERHHRRWAPRRRFGRFARLDGVGHQENENQQNDDSMATDSSAENFTKDLTSNENKIVGSGENNQASGTGCDLPANQSEEKESNKGIVERTPVHRNETDEAATISIDVTGFSIDQLQVRLEEENVSVGTTRPILTLSGERTNPLGDVFKIHRRFLLERENLDKDLQEIAITANLSKEGILTIQVPKKKKDKEEKKPEKVCRTILVKQSTNGGTDNESKENKEEGK